MNILMRNILIIQLNEKLFLIELSSIRTRVDFHA